MWLIIRRLLGRRLVFLFLLRRRRAPTKEPGLNIFQRLRARGPYDIFLDGRAPRRPLPHDVQRFFIVRLVDLCRPPALVGVPGLALGRAAAGLGDLRGLRRILIGRGLLGRRVVGVLRRIVVLVGVLAVFRRGRR